ncbi:MAG: MmcQ/YjbR family DNA-binding protein [Muribaculaceae bacterium]|nr:MmcQ/YjbR family DNA-binding protein [Muribaculaceae bacterium]
MDIENFREYCLAMEFVTEKTPFGKFARRYDSILVFYVHDHMFCFIDMDDFSFVNVRLNPEEIDEIRSNHSSVGDPINQSLKYWIRLDFDGDISDNDIYRFVERAYHIVRHKYRKKENT